MLNPKWGRNMSKSKESWTEAFFEFGILIEYVDDNEVMIIVQ